MVRMNQIFNMMPHAVSAAFALTPAGGTGIDLDSVPPVMRLCTFVHHNVSVSAVDAPFSRLQTCSPGTAPANPNRTVCSDGSPGVSSSVYAWQTLQPHYSWYRSPRSAVRID
jgi:hypothetical protein